ncbi:glycosyltransferase 87 family protein [Frigoribacterium faeni]|uniref:F0F1-type ATP synthase assembly protein I n=1 Tax=Frigoribacterium faeni TaxID=145483 RepID=A0A7W3JGK8_9MICO|nr:glycosyltransferase 87 family protein [Frigoribacterium faeni]MBA8812492.1 F0F1-type ATP synthase assembly protein I [Frigoribacterium faeni]BFF13582.1 glycosyltransferase family 87 protein [Microbacterium flavescens]GEK81791.1 membrane protein [Frigoribacterium faeni]
MTVAAPPEARRAPGAAGRLVTDLARRRTVLWAAFAAVHLWLIWINLVGPDQSMGDVWTVYRQWMQEAVDGGARVGVDRPWVYPLLAAVPMLLARLGGDAHYGDAWLVVVLALNAGAFAVLTRRGGGRPLTAAWWWLAFLLALGPIALGRIDAVTVPLALVGLLLVATRPLAASVLLTVAAWVKVWPAALVAAALISSRHRWSVLLGAVATTAAVVAVSLALGSGATVLGFVGQQAGRGLQIESPAATPWLWRAAAGVAGTAVYYDREILTFQVSGDGVGFAARATTVIMALVVVGVVLLGLRARRAGVAATRLLGPLSLALTVALIATNKVGSPQFVAWLAVPVVVGLVASRPRRDGAGSSAAGTAAGPSFRLAAVVALVVGGLTQVIYPWFYDDLLTVQPWMLVVITLRNLGEIVLLVVACVMLWRLGGVRARGGADRMGA